MRHLLSERLGRCPADRRGVSCLDNVHHFVTVAPAEQDAHHVGSDVVDFPSSA